ncbi:hypothetical protein [Paenibacillus amylolyticus]|uniref:hypothetical protein n=1 Tax=Paenibacillus amylolyticus TaxID=1451 RepID=UPI003398CBF2
MNVNTREILETLNVNLSDFEEYIEYHITVCYGVEAKRDFLNLCNSNLLLAVYLYNNNYISKEKMIDDIVIQSLMKGTRYEDNFDIDSMVNECFYDKEEIRLQIDYETQEYRYSSSIIPFVISRISNKDMCYIQQVMRVENKYMYEKQFQLHSYSLEQVIPYNLLENDSQLFYAYESNVIYIITGLGIRYIEAE